MTAEGLAKTEVWVAFRDRGGALWFGTFDGLSKLTPAPDRSTAPPPILISGLRIAGKAHISMIASLSRDLADSMSDIVWAINLQRDHLSDLTHRMRRFASDVFDTRGVDFSFHAPDDHHDIKVGADMRREVYLIFKESVNNAVRHSECTRADIAFLIKHGHLELLVSDDGKGFDMAGADEGNGLASKRQRAKRIGGELEIISTVGEGTTVKLIAPAGR
jgi:signal transduction histidine kinase